MSAKEILGALAIAAGLIRYALYLWGIFRRAIRPHMFTWLVWAVLMSIGFAAQHAEKAGPGAWNLGVCAVITALIALLSYFRGEKNITGSDWAALIVALLAVSAWLATANPLWAVIIISLIDAAAFYPTFRKSWLKPQEEGAFSFSVGIVQFLLSVAALEKMTLVTLLYPLTIAALNMALVLMLLWRRRTA